MFEDLARFDQIIVSGPHRSGTTICGEMIAADLGYSSIREEGFGWSKEDQFRKLLERRGVVLQAPFFAHLLHAIPTWTNKNLCVVMMLRSLEDIRLSQSKMLTDTGEPTGDGIREYRLRQYHGGTPDPGIVYENWADQKGRIPNWVEVSYDRLAAHPLWVSDRSRFHFRQTR